MKVTVYKRNTSTNISSLSLDFYVNGKRVRRALGLYYYRKPIDVNQRKHNKQTKIMIDTIVAEKTLEIQKGVHGLLDNRNKYTDFIGYFKHLVSNRLESGVNYNSWKTTEGHLKDYAPLGISFKSISVEWIEGFRDYLQYKKKLKSASVMQYYNLLKHSVHEAYRKKLIIDDFAVDSKGIRVETAERQFLSKEELIKLKDTPCRNEILKKAFLFSSLTGMAFADIKKLTWAALKGDNSQWSINFHRKKTKGLQYHPISKVARELLGPKSDDEARIFFGLKYNTWNNIELKRWILEAGITKEITFHCARHSYATNLLSSGVPITTLKELLGHKDFKTTMIYAKIVDSDKVKAADLMNFEI